MKKRVYSTEFKSEAVRLSYQRENIKELTDELGVQVQRIYKWRAGQKTKSSPKITIKSEVDSIEVKRLHKALKEKELELEILKKAVHIFSKSDRKSVRRRHLLKRSVLYRATGVKKRGLCSQQAKKE